ncbi:TetR/AcrR family transcriptional regulator [Vibrio sp.]|nr:TetR/AcrR family transcriptional regulator [Vibrio sp.]
MTQNILTESFPFIMSQELKSNTLKRRRGRPPKIERDFSDTRKEILKSGVEIITENGFMSSGIDTIVKRVGVPKGSFYHYFKSKEEFGCEVIAEYGRYFAKKLDRHLSNKEQPSLNRMDSFVQDAKQGMLKFNFRRGCLVGNMMQESPQLSDACNAQLRHVLDSWKDKIRQCLIEASQTNQCKNDIDTDLYANLFWSGWEGAVMRAKLFESTAPLDDFWAFYRDAIQ